MKTCTQCKMRYPNEQTHCFVEGAELVPLPDPQVGKLLAGRYVIEEVVGEGGMATVYAARHNLVDRRVAVKMLNPMLATDAVVRERFRREARNAQKLAHPNIIEIFDQGETEEGAAYIVMELLHGASLGETISRGPMDVDRAIHVMVQIARGIARAHDLDVVHRDLKPENIFLCRREDGSDLVKLLDFGIARSRQDSRLTGQGELFGTPQYMAPERIMGDDAGASSDIYALGVMFFELVTGQLPFDAPDIASFFMKHLHEPPRPLRSLNGAVPPALDDLVLRMLAKTPGERPVDAHRIHQDLLGIIADREIPPPPETEAEPTSLGAAPVVTAVTNELWDRRIAVLDKMLARAYGAAQLAPRELTQLLEQVSEKVRRVGELRAESVHTQNELGEIELRGRDKRAQLGRAIDQLGVDGSKAKDEVRAAHESAKRAEGDVTQARQRFEAAHREVVYWEGRSGMAEPSTDLALAYRHIADAVDEWSALREQERRALEEAEAAERVAHDLDFQIRELRSAVQTYEQDFDEQRSKREEIIQANGNEADKLETELLELTTRFCKPLRARPDLAPLFKELETEAAA